MMRRKLLLPSLLASLTGFVAVLGCGPIGPIPGGRLRGELVEEAVVNWSFAASEQTLQLETRPGDPHSVTAWFVSLGSELYVPSRDPEEKQWVRNVNEDPRVRLRIAGKLYPRSAARVSDRAELERVFTLLIDKYSLEREDEALRSRVAVFRMSPR